MDIAEFDFAVRVATLTVFALMALVLLRDQRDRLAARLALLMIASRSCYVLAVGPVDRPVPPLFFWVTWIGQIAEYGLFWLFAKAWFNDETRVSVVDLVIVLASILYGILTRSFVAVIAPYSGLADAILRLIWMAFVFDGLRIAWLGRKDDLVEARRKIRTTFVWTTGVALFAITAIYFYYNQYLGVFAPWAVQAPIDTAILLLSASLFLAITGISDADLFATSPNGRDPPLFADEAACDAVITRLSAHMESERAWRDEKLTIATLAARIGEQEYRLRRVINGRMGFRNFAAFLNRYRLAEVKTTLADPEQRDVPILTIALDAGFGSLGPFNRAFREAEGMTPSAYRASFG